MLDSPRAREGPDPLVAAALKAAEVDDEAREDMVRRAMEVGRSMQGRRERAGLLKNGTMETTGLIGRPAV